MTQRWKEIDVAYYNAQRRLMADLAKAPHKPVVQYESPETL